MSEAAAGHALRAVAHEVGALLNIGRAYGARNAPRTVLMRLVARRVLLVIPILFVASLLTFFIVNELPGSAAQQLLGIGATPEQVAALEAKLNLGGEPWPRYARWLVAASTGDLGNSLASGLAVAPLLEERLPVTLELVMYAFVLALGFAIPTALLCARYPAGLVDRLFAAITMIGLSVPNYVLALLLVLVFAMNLHLFPSIGFTPINAGLTQNIASLTLPALALAFPLFCFYARFLRGDLLEQMQGEEYVIAAAAKGLGPWRVLLRHALRNSLFGLLTILGLHVGTLVGGSVIIEQIFALPGMGQLLLQAIETRDVPVIQAIVLLLTFVVVVVNLALDVLYAVLDPRIRYAER